MLENYSVWKDRSSSVAWEGESKGKKKGRQTDLAFLYLSSSSGQTGEFRRWSQKAEEKRKRIKFRSVFSVKALSLSEKAVD